VSDLLDSEVDWDAGRVTRKRSKTKDRESVPVVCYPLWPGTFALLQEHRSGSERVLLTARGKPLVQARADVLAGNFKLLQKRIGFKKSMKLIRQSSASMLEGHRDYGRLVPLFLGHTPPGRAARHDAQPAPALLDEAVAWLGRQYGLI
jgi:hypothetical protein